MYLIVIEFFDYLKTIIAVPGQNDNCLGPTISFYETKQNLGEKFRFMKRNIEISSDFPNNWPKNVQNEILTKRNLGEQFRSTKQNNIFSPQIFYQTKQKLRQLAEKFWSTMLNIYK